MLTRKIIRAPYGLVMSALRHPSRSRQHPRIFEVTLRPNEVAWNPDRSQQFPIFGPAFLSYTLHDDDSVTLSQVRLDEFTPEGER